MYTRCSKKVGKSKYFWDNFKQCFPLKKIFVMAFLNSKLLTKNCGQSVDSSVGYVLSSSTNKSKQHLEEKVLMKLISMKIVEYVDYNKFDESNLFFDRKLILKFLLLFHILYTTSTENIFYKWTTLWIFKFK